MISNKHFWHNGWINRIYLNTATDRDKELLFPQAPSAAATPNRKADLTTLLAEHQQGWYQRTGNVGAGFGQDPGMARALGILGLGSYKLTREGSLQRRIDELAQQQAGLDINSTMRLANLMFRAHEKLKFLTAKTEVCHQIEQAIDQLTEENRRASELIAQMKKSFQPGIIARLRYRARDQWEATRDVFFDEGVGRGVTAAAGTVLRQGLEATAVAAGTVGAVGAVGLGVVAAPWYATAGVLGLGTEAYHRRQMKREDVMKILPQLKVKVHNTLQKTEAEKKKLQEGAEKKYAPELSAIKNIYALVKLKCGEQEAATLNEAMLAKDNQTITAILARYQTDPRFTPDQKYALQQFRALLTSRRAQNCMIMVDSTLNHAEITNPQELGKGLEQMVEANNRLLPLAGKKITWSGATYDLVDLQQTGLKIRAVLALGGKKMVLKSTKDSSNGQYTLETVSVKNMPNTVLTALQDINNYPPANRNPELTALIEMVQQGRASFPEYFRLVQMMTPNKVPPIFKKGNRIVANIQEITDNFIEIKPINGNVSFKLN